MASGTVKGVRKTPGKNKPGDFHPLTCSNLVYGHGGKRLIDGVSLRFATSGITTIMGFNGAGKSLLLRLLHGLIQPSSGGIMWNDKPLGSRERRLQAMVFQKPVLLRRTVLENMRFVLSATGVAGKGHALEALDRVGLAHLAAAPARRLSGGEQQRLALGLALARTPQVLFLDEATSNLDPGSVSVLENVVSGAAMAGTKIIMVSHDIGQARRLADEIVFLHEGRIEETAEAGTFFSKTGSAAARAYLEGKLPASGT